jgi:hypothetical protein
VLPAGLHFIFTLWAHKKFEKINRNMEEVDREKTKKKKYKLNSTEQITTNLNPFPQ